MTQNPTLPTAAKIGLWTSGSWLVLELMRGGIPWTPAFALTLVAIWALSAASPKGLWKDHQTAGVFLVCLAAYLSTFRWHGGDDITNSLIPFALMKHGTLALNPVIDPWLTDKTNDFTFTFGKHLISFHPIGGGLLSLPVYLIPVLAHAPVSETFLHNLSKVSASLITAASAAIFYRAVKDRCSRLWGLTLAAFYGLGSFSFSVSSQALWEHGPAQLGFAIALLGLSRAGFKADMLIGFGLGLSLVARTDMALFAAAIGGYLFFHDPKRIIGGIVGAVLPLGFLAGYWLYFTGRIAPPETNFQTGLMRGFQPAAFIGLILSPTRGLLFFFPVGFFGIWAGLKTMKKHPLAGWLLAACLGTWVLFSHYYAWVGGMSFGPRYFAVLVLALAYILAGAEKDIKKNPALLRAFTAAGVFGILVHALGGYFSWPGSFGVSYAKEQLWHWGLHPALFMFQARGPLGGLPGPARVLVALAIVSAFAEGGRRLYGALRRT